MPRSFIGPDGGRLSQDVQKDIQTVLQVESFKGEDTESHVNELFDVFEEIEFDTLKDIFFEDARRAGVSEQDLNFLDTENIYATKKRGSRSRSGYETLSNLIHFDHLEIKEVAQKNGVSYKLLVLSLLCHEEAHATGFIEIKSLLEMIKQVSIRKGESYIKSGIQFQELSESRSEKLTSDPESQSGKIFKMLEEGISEKIAQEVMDKYMKRDPDFATAEEVKKFLDTRQENQNFNMYPASLDMVHVITAVISNVVQMPEYTVWQAIKRAHYEGFDWSDSQNRALWDSIFSDEFLELLAHVDSQEMMGALVYVLSQNLSRDGKAEIVEWSKLYLNYVKDI